MGECELGSNCNKTTVLIENDTAYALNVNKAKTTPLSRLHQPGTACLETSYNRRLCESHVHTKDFKGMSYWQISNTVKQAKPDHNTRKKQKVGMHRQKIGESAYDSWQATEQV